MGRRVGILGVAIAGFLATVGLWWALDDETEGDAVEPGLSTTILETRRPSLVAHERAPTEGSTHSAGGIDGTVTRAGRPLSAVVQVYRLSTGRRGRPAWIQDPGRWRNSARSKPTARESAVTECGPDGQFAVDGLSRGHYRVVASTGGASGSCRHQFLTGDGERVRMDIDLPPGDETLRGRVRYAGGEPWSGRVYATTTTDRRWFTGLLPGDPGGAETDAQGRFTLEHVPYGPIRLHAIDAEGVRVLPRRIWVPVADDIEIVVPDRSTWIDVNVVSADRGQPIDQALVLGAAYSRAPGVHLFHSVRTDSEGRAGLPIGNDDIWITVKARGWAQAYVKLAAGERAAWISLSRTATVKGRVVAKDSGDPVAGAGISLGSQGEAITDQNGRFEMQDAPLGFHWFRIDGDSWRPWSLDGAEGGGWPIDVAPDSTASIELVAWQGGAVQGRVCDSTGNAIAGATVCAHRVKEDDLSERVDGAAITAEDGSFNVAGLVTDDTYAFRAVAVGFAPSVSAHWKHTAEDTRPPIEIALRPPRRIDVRVLDLRGAPVRGVRVGFSAGDPAWTYAVTGDDGWVRVTGLSRSSLQMFARRVGFEVHSRTIDAAADDLSGPETFEVALGGSATVTGRLVWSDGSPVVGHEVEIAALEKEATTDVDGAFRMTWIPAGRHLIQAKDARVDPPRIAETWIESGTGPVVLRFDAPPPEQPTSTTLQIKMPSGLPVANAQVRVQYESETVSHGAENGTLELPSGWISLTVYDAEASSGAPLPLGPVTVGPHDGDALAVTLPKELTISGFVFAEDGPGLGAARVSAKGETPVVDWMLSDATGAFHIGRLPAGPHTLAVRPPPGYVAETLPVEAGTSGVTIVVRREAAATIRVVDDAERPVPGVNVNWKRIDDSPHDQRREGSLTTDAEGRAQPSGLDRDGTYRLQVTPDQGAGFHRRVFDPWRPGNIDVTLERALVVQGTVVDLDGRAVPGVEVIGTQGDATQGTTCDPHGRFELGGFRPGPVLLYARSDNDGSWIKPLESTAVDVAAGDRGARVKVDAGLSIRVHVLGLGSEADAVVWGNLTPEPLVQPADVTLDDFLRPTGVKAHEDTFVLRNAVPGTRYTLWAGPLPDGRMVHETGLTGRREVYRTTTRRGGRVAGVVHAPPGLKSIVVHLTGPACSAETHADAFGAFEFRGLPPGRVTLSAFGGLDAAPDDPWGARVITHEGTAEVVVGGSTTIRLRATEDD